MRWFARAELSKDGVLSLSALDEAGQEKATLIASTSPVELMLGAVAACFVKSVHGVLKARREEMVAVRADVTGEKSAAPPARVAQVTIRYAMPGLAADHAAALAKDAKRVCTVTNSMSCEFQLVA